MRFDRERPTSLTGRARSLRRRMTWAEQALWHELRKLDANFRRQAPIGPYFVDFATHGGKLVIEVDGEIHERLDEVMLRDHEKKAWLEGQGYRVIRFANREVEADLSGCVERVRALLLDGGGLGGGVGLALKDASEWAPTPSGIPSPTPCAHRHPRLSSIEEEGR